METERRRRRWSNHRPRLHLSDVRGAEPAGRDLLRLLHGLKHVGKMTVLLSDGRAGLVGRPFVDFFSEAVQALASSWGSWGVLDPTLAAFSVLRPSHNNQQ